MGNKIFSRASVSFNHSRIVLVTAYYRGVGVANVILRKSLKCFRSWVNGSLIGLCRKRSRKSNPELNKACVPNFQSVFAAKWNFILVVFALYWENFQGTC